MKVLLLTQVLPYPPDSGPKVKTFNVLKYLSRRHEVTLASFVRGDQEGDVAQLKKYCQVHTVPMQRTIWHDGIAMLRSLFGRQPWMMVRDDRLAMRALVDSLASRTSFDVVHADQLNMAQYALRVRQTFKVLDTHNALWLLYKRLWETLDTGLRKMLLGRDWGLIKAYEGKICRKFDAVLAVSDEDRVALKEAAGEAQSITVIPIAVDTAELLPVSRDAHARHILHIGTMFWPPNIDGVRWFIQEVLPLIRTRQPDVVFDVVGARPPSDLVQTGAQESTVNVTGYVEDPQPYLEQAGVMVVPLRAGGGMRVKILNAMAQALPIVSTTIGCEGIQVIPGRDLLLADTPEAFANAVLRLLQNRELANKLGQNGRKLVRVVYDYRHACRPLDRLYARAFDSRYRPQPGVSRVGD